MSDEELQRFYERAAHDDAFREALWNDYEGTIDATDLAPHVKAMLKSVSPEQLAVMVRKATGVKLVRWGAIGKVVLGVGAAAVAAAILLPALQGATRETSIETTAMSTLQQLSLVEQQYKTRYGTFGALDDLARFEDGQALTEWMRDGEFPYEFTLTVDGDTFTGTARHKTRPDTRKAFIVGPDGAVRELKDEESSAQ
ncbi:MAG: hypothetical protein JW889_10935 [Verrucomicrobia bacterium]|nr:hypothetical protein [Verrucomicrobiota bacterium]